jgi:hypothetical protein
MTNDEIAYKQLLDDIGSEYSDSYLLNFAAARLSHALGNNALCIRVLENRPTDQGKYPFHYLDYLQAISYLYSLDYERSEMYFNRFLKNFKGNNYIKSAYQKLSWIAFLQQKSDEEMGYLKKIKLEGKAYIDEDKVAFKEAEKNHINSPILLRARLLYDGGYYEKALLELNSIINLSDYSLFFDEYYYRLARIQSKLNYMDEQVIAKYQKSFDLGKKSTNYYAPMSALQIGLIYEKKNDTKKAIIYFEKCLSISNFDYERGIHQKAKSGLNRAMISLEG